MSTNPLPKSVKLGGRTYRVEIVNGLRAPDSGEPCFGTIQHSQALICLDADSPTEFQWQILWHELIHAFLFNAGIGDHSEQQIIAMANQIQAVLVQNGAKILPTK